MKNLIFLVILFFSSTLNANYKEEWFSRYNGIANGQDIPGNKMALDINGNSYIVGTVSSGSSTGDDVIIIKYNSSGLQQWISTLNFTSSDVGSSLAIDNLGNIYVTGNYADDVGSSYTNIFTAKYSSNGVRQWVASYNGPSIYSQDAARDIEIDKFGNVIVTGSSETWNTLVDIYTIKYSNNGTVLWTGRYDQAGLYDYGYEVETDNLGNVYVLGEVTSGSTHGADIVLIKYNPYGVREWVGTYQSIRADVPASLVVDIHTGDAYATGFSNRIFTKGPPSTYSNDILTMKYKTNGEREWVRFYNNSGLNDQGVKIDLHKERLGVNDAKLFVTGISNGDVVTLKYDAFGNLNWIRSFNSNEGLSDEPQGIDTDNDGNVYIAGYSGSNQLYKYLILKYNINGDLIWSHNSSDLSTNRQLSSIRVSPNGNRIIVNGLSTEFGTSYDITTLSFVESPDYSNIKSTSINFRNYPNPFNPTTKINFDLSKGTNVKLTIYNSLGQVVMNLFEGYKAAGSYQAEFNGSSLASGTYYYRIDTDFYTETKKMQLVK